MNKSTLNNKPQLLLINYLNMNKAVSEALEKVGNQGRYQTILGFLLFFAACEVNMLFFGPTFIYMNPSFNCSFVEGSVDESVACPRINECIIKNSFTLTAVLELYCDRQALRTIIQSISAFGAVVGLLLINYISDTRGRKIGVIIPQLIGIFSVCLTLLGGWIESVPIIIVAQFFAGMASFGLINSAYIIPGEFCDNELRQRMTVYVNYAWGFTTIMIGVLYFHYNIWYKYLIVFLLIPFILILIATMYYMVESPFFLHQEGRWEEYLESLKVIASYNNTKFDQNQVMKMSKENVLQPGEELTFLEVICDPYYLKLIALLSLTSIGIEVFYMGKSYTLDLTGWEYGYSCLLNGIAELVGFMLLSLVANKMPRKSGILASAGILILLGLIFFSRQVVDNHTLQMIIFGVVCIVGTFVYTAILLYASELFPSKVSASSLGVIDAIGQLGIFIGPFVVTFGINNQIYPLALLSILEFIFIIIPLLIIDESRVHKHHEEQQFGVQQEK